MSMDEERRARYALAIASGDHHGSGEPSERAWEYIGEADAAMALADEELELQAGAGMARAIVKHTVAENARLRLTIERTRAVLDYNDNNCLTEKTFTAMLRAVLEGEAA